MAAKQNNASLDVLKGIAAILIILIHAPISGVVGQYIIAVARSGVALFFLISGFYMYSEDTSRVRERASKKLKRTMQLALWAYSFYFAWGVFVRYVGTGMNSVTNWFRSLAKPYTLVRFFILHEDVLAGHLWFINALAICYIFALFLGRQIYERVSLYVAIVLLSCNFILMNVLPKILANSIPMTVCRNGWFYGMPIFLIGFHIHKCFDFDRRIDNSKITWITFISLALIGVERAFWGYSQLYLGNIILLCCLFVWAEQNPNLVKLRLLRKIGANYSMNMYVIQWAVINIGVKFLKMIGMGDKSNLLAIMSVLGTMLGAVVLRMIQDSRKKHRKVKAV